MSTAPHTAYDRPPAAAFFVPGRAAPGGSKRGIVHRHTGKVVMIDMGKNNKGWRADVARAARRAFAGPLLDGPLEAFFAFTIARPRCHYRTGRYALLLRDDAPPHPVGPPDVLKLARAAEDALTGVVWTDDARIVREVLTKAYGDTPGVRVVVRRVED